MKTSTAVLLTVLIILGLAGGGYYYLNKQNQTDKKALQTQINDLSAKLTTEKAAPTAVTATTETADWKTYTSTFGYLIKYPSSWTLDTRDEKLISLNSPKTEEEYKQILATPPGYSDGYRPDIYVTYYENLAAADGNNPKKYSTFSDYVNDASIFSNLKETTFAGQKAYQVVEGGMGPSEMTILQKNGHIYTISFGYTDVKTKTAETNTVINSFQFAK